MQDAQSYDYEEYMKLLTDLEYSSGLDRLLIKAKIKRMNFPKIKDEVMFTKSGNTETAKRYMEFTSNQTVEVSRTGRKIPNKINIVPRNQHATDAELPNNKIDDELKPYMYELQINNQMNVVNFIYFEMMVIDEIMRTDPELLEMYDTDWSKCALIDVTIRETERNDIFEHNVKLLGIPADIVEPFIDDISTEEHKTYATIMLRYKTHNGSTRKYIQFSDIIAMDDDCILDRKGFLKLI